MRSYANYLAPHRIPVNSVHPTGVNTPMVVNDIMQAFLASDPSLSQAMANALPVDMVEPADVSNAILWLVSDDARYVTGVTLPVDVGFTNKEVRTVRTGHGNPYDNVGATRLSTSVHDQICRLAIGYQDAAAALGAIFTN